MRSRTWASTSWRPASPSPPRRLCRHRQHCREVRGPRIASLARARSGDIERAARSLERAQTLAHPHLSRQLGHSPGAQAEDHPRRGAGPGRTAVRLARTYVDDVEFSPEDATRSDPDFLCRMVAVAIEAGATVINLPDTVGYCVPNEYAAMFRMMRERVPGAGSCFPPTATTISGWRSPTAWRRWRRSAADRVHHQRHRRTGRKCGAGRDCRCAAGARATSFPIAHGLELEQLYPTSQLLAELISFTPAPNKAVVGSNAFAHEAGIHQHGMLAHPLTYEIMTPASVGVPTNRMVLGKHSGRRALAHRAEGARLSSSSRRSGRGLSPLHRTGGPQKGHLRPGPDLSAGTSPAHEDLIS